MKRNWTGKSEKFKVTYLPSGATLEVDPSQYPYGTHGEPGSLLDIALGHGVKVPLACGGVGVCGTCHVIVESGMDNLSKPTDDELDTIQMIPNNTKESRLACQALVKGDVTVRVAGK